MSERSNEEVLDLSNLRAIAGGDDAFVVALLMKMCAALPVAYENMEQAAEAEDWPALMAAAHKAKSTFAYLGMEGMHAQLAGIEHRAREAESPETLRAAVEKTVGTGRKILDGLNAELERLNGG